MHRRLIKRAVLSVAFVGLGLSGCEHSEHYRWSGLNTPEFTSTLRAPASSEFAGWATPSVSVYSYATPTPPVVEMSLKDLSDRGQSAFIEAMARSGGTAAELRELLARPIRATPPVVEGATTTEGTYKRTLVANVTKGWSARPGERLVWTWIHVQPLNFLFDGYTVAATDRQLLAVGQIGHSTAIGVGGSLGQTSTDTGTTTTAAPPVTSVLARALGATAGLTGSFNNTTTSSASINQQYTPLGVDILPTELRIYRESERNLDAAGNSLIALTMRVDDTRWTELSHEITQRVTSLDLARPDGSFQAPADVTFEVTRNRAPPHCPLLADVTLIYQFREVEDGRSYIEGQHRADYRQDSSTTRGVIVVPADEVRRPSWRIYPGQSSSQALRVLDVFGYENPLDFTTFEQARNFAQWLNDPGNPLLTQERPSIGKAGLVLTSGVHQEPLSPGPYIAKRLEDPSDQSAICEGMNG